jgi:hypothetical protein
MSEMKENARFWLSVDLQRAVLKAAGEGDDL